MKRLLASLLLLGLATSCTTPVFNHNMTVSTSSRAVEGVKRLKAVRTESCSYVVLFLIPIPYDPRAMFDELLAQAKKQGGNAVVDFQMRSSGALFLWAYDSFCEEAVGTAAILPAS